MNGLDSVVKFCVFILVIIFIITLIIIFIIIFTIILIIIFIIIPPPGIALIILGQLVSASQLVLEERLLKKRNFPPLQVH